MSRVARCARALMWTRGLAALIDLKPHVHRELATETIYEVDELIEEAEAARR